jgi:hypothetical protein
MLLKLFLKLPFLIYFACSVGYSATHIPRLKYVQTSIKSYPKKGKNCQLTEATSRTDFNLYEEIGEVILLNSTKGLNQREFTKLAKPIACQAGGDIVLMRDAYYRRYHEGIVLRKKQVND